MKNARARVLRSPADSVFLKLGWSTGVSAFPKSTGMSLMTTQNVEFGMRPVYSIFTWSMQKPALNLRRLAPGETRGDIRCGK